MNTSQDTTLTNQDELENILHDFADEVRDDVISNFEGDLGLMIDRTINLITKSATKASEQRIQELEKFRNGLIDHFIVAFRNYDNSKSAYENISELIAYYQEIALDPRVSQAADELHGKIKELTASNNQLREALESAWHYVHTNKKLMDNISTLLSATPTQSLALHDNEVIERCAMVADEQMKEHGGQDYYIVGCSDAADAIRALKVTI